MKKIKIEKRRFQIILIGLISVCLLFSVFAFVYNTKTTKIVVVDKYYISDKLNYFVYLRPNTLFNATVLKNCRIYVNITKNVEARYTFNVRNVNGTTIRGTYEILATLRTREWNKTIVLCPLKSYIGGYNVEFPLDFARFWQLYSEINRDLGFKATNPKVFVTITTKVASKDFHSTYTHTLWFPLARDVIDIHTSKSSEKVKSLTKLVRLEDPGKVMVKMILIFVSVISLIAAGLFYWIAEPTLIEKDEATRIYEKYRDLMVLSDDVGINKIEHVVTVRDIEDLLKIAEILNKPIIRAGSTFYIIEKNIIYRYNV